MIALRRAKERRHDRRREREVWLTFYPQDLVAGEITLGDLVLSAGDGAGLTAERSVSFTAREETEVLLVDMGDASAAARRGEVR